MNRAEHAIVIQGTQVGYARVCKKMIEKDSNLDGKPKTDAKKGQKQERLARQLRENLLRRKQKEKTGESGDTSDKV